jgi:fructose-specific PTS system IIA-like component
MCGEMAGRVEYLPLLVGLDVDELSMAPPAIAEVKAELLNLSFTACQAHVSGALDCASAREVEHLLGDLRANRAAPLIDPELVVIGSDCRTRDEAIKELVDRLYVTGRTDRPRDVEEAVWQREAVYSTGFGHGFAIPHCKSDAVGVNSLAVLKLDEPVEWGSLDDQPVRVVLLLAIRESDQATAHMKVLAALARRLMHEEFRERLAEEQDPAALCQFLQKSIAV